MSKIVLCVDDSATMQQVADITFRGTEFTYVGARSYVEGLDKAKTQRPVVVLADSVMPGKNGYDLCLALKSDGATADVPVVILIGNGAPFDAARGTQVGADANLPKPWDTQTMLDKVIEVVTKAASGVARPGAGAPAAAAAPAAPAAAAPAAASKPNPAAAATSAAAASMAPRSATIMGMPTVKTPAGTAPTVPVAATPPAAPPAPAPPAPVAAPPTPSKHVVAATPPPTAPAPTATVPGTSAGLRAPAATPARGHDGVTPAHAPPAAAAPAAAAHPPAAAAAPAVSIAAAQRPPMISGIPTKRSALVERALAKMAARLAETAGLEPGSPELLALLKLSTEVVERIVWEVVPDLAEQIIRENLQELAARRS